MRAWTERTSQRGKTSYNFVYHEHVSHKGAREKSFCPNSIRPWSKIQRKSSSSREYFHKNNESSLIWKASRRKKACNESKLNLIMYILTFRPCLPWKLFFHPFLHIFHILARSLPFFHFVFVLCSDEILARPWKGNCIYALELQSQLDSCYILLIYSTSWAIAEKKMKKWISFAYLLFVFVVCWREKWTSCIVNECVLERADKMLARVRATVFQLI